MENSKMSGKLAPKMSLTVEDQQYIKRLFDREEEISMAHSEKVIQTVRDMIEKQTQKFEKRFDDIDKRLDAIEVNLNDKEKRLLYLEKYASWPHTVLRHAIAIIIGIMIGWAFHTMVGMLLNNN